MKFSSLTARVGGEGADAWEVHYAALTRAAAGEDVIVLSIGEERDEVTPAHIVAAAVESLQGGRHHYAEISGTMELRRAVAEFHRKQSGQAVEAENCAVFGGAQNALFAVAQCLLEKGDEVILSEPYYTTYPAVFSAAGAELVRVAVRKENGFQIAPREIIARMTRRTRAVVLNSPSNPLGAVYTREQVREVVRECVARDIWVIFDDVYQEFLRGEERAGALAGGLTGEEAAEFARVCVTISSLSKSHRMTGWRLGWVVASRELVGHLYNLALCMTYGMPPFIQDAAVVALRGGNGAAVEIRGLLERRREVFLEAVGGAVADSGLGVFATPGAMFAVLDISGVGGKTFRAREFAKGLLAEQGVSILPCDGFGVSDGVKDLLRVSLCADEGRLAEAGRRIGAYIAGRVGG